MYDMYVYVYRCRERVYFVPQQEYFIKYFVPQHNIS